MHQPGGTHPTQATDQSTGECRHLYMTSDATCVHCGLKFHLAWTAEPRSLTAHGKRNATFVVVFGLLMVFFAMLQIDLLFYIAMAGTVMFAVRAGLSWLELYQRHGFVPGKLGPLSKQGAVNFLLPRPYLMFVGFSRFPVDKETYDQFNQGDTVLVEHLRWSRLPVAIYRGGGSQGRGQS